MCLCVHACVRVCDMYVYIYVGAHAHTCIELEEGIGILSILLYQHLALFP